MGLEGGLEGGEDGEGCCAVGEVRGETGCCCEVECVVEWEEGLGRDEAEGEDGCCEEPDEEGEIWSG